MDRRELLQTGLAAFAGTAFAGSAPAQTSIPPGAKLKIAACSRHLQWLRSPEDVARACIEMAFDGLDVSVQSYPGHVDPARVGTDLPAFVKAIRSRGLAVDMIATGITDADSPDAEAVLAAASSLGIGHYACGGYRYDVAAPLAPQIDALKPRLSKLVALNRKYGMKGLYRNRAGAANAGSAILDLLPVLRNFDSRHIGFLYDSGEAAQAGGIDTWALGLRLAGPYIGGVAFTDSILKLRLNTEEGGPFSGTPEQLNTFRASASQRSPYGGGGQTNPWQAMPVPLGTGLVDLPQMARILKDAGFQGPLEIAAEYPNGGADRGADKIAWPPARVLGAMKRDLLTLKVPLGQAGLI